MAVAKVFRIEMQGGRVVEKDVVAIKKAITEMGRAIKLAKGELSVLLAGQGDASAINTLNKRITELEGRLKSLSQQRKDAEVDAKRAAEAEKLLADAKLKVAKADRERINAQIAQEKELDRQIALENKQSDALRRQKSIADALPGSYNAIKASLAALRPFIQSGGLGGSIAFNGQQINFDQAIAEFKQLSAAEQDFRRQFARDGLLVGEYTSGIVQAFHQLNIDDIIKGQVNGARQQLGQLETKTKDLVVAYRQAQQSGSADLNKLEKEIHDNVVETQRLKAAVGQAEVQLKGMGGVGSQISAGINKNFKDLKNSIGQFALGFVGFQAVIGGVQKTFGDTVKLDSLAAAMQVVSGNEQELAINNQFLEKTIQSLGLETISATLAFKNFYAASTQAGISADQTREIYFAAASAAANLKLSQEDTNGVLLAFSQIASKGKVQAEELRGQIGERVPGAFAIAARAIGVTQTELNKMLEKGEVIAADFLPKFAKELQNTFGGDTTKNITGLQASVNRLKNEFTALLQDNQSGLSSFFSFLIESARILIKLIPALVTLTFAWAASWVILNTQMLIAKGHLLFQRTIMPVLIVLTGGYSNALKVQAFFTAAASRSLAFLSSVMANPIFRIFAAILGVSLLTMKAYGRSLSEASTRLGQVAQKQQFLNEAQAEANKQLSETKAKEEALLAIIRDRTLADQTRTNALNQLKGIMGEYGEALTLENVLTAEGTKLIKEFNEAMLRRGRITAAETIAQRENQKLQTLLQNQFDIEDAIKNKGVINTGQLSEDVLEAYYQATGRSASAIGKFLGDKVGIDFTYEGKDLKKFSEIIKKRIDDQLKKTTGAELAKIDIEQTAVLEDKAVLNASYNKITENINVLKASLTGLKEGSKEYEKIAADISKNEIEREAVRAKILGRSGPAGRTIEAIEADLKKANDNFNSAVVGSKAAKDFKAKIAKFEEELRLAKGDEKKTPASRASRLTGEQKDDFKDIEAIRDRLLAEQGKLFADQTIDEKTYLTNVLKINTDAINKKLAIIKGKNAEERKIIAELNLQKVNDQKETNKKLFDLENKQLEINLRNATAAAQQELDVKLSDPQLEEADRLKARGDFNNKLLVAQILFNQDQIALEKLYAIQSIENEQQRKEAIEKLNKELQNILLALPEARIKDIQTAAQKQLDEQRRFIASEARKILEDESLTNKEKAQKLDELETTGLVSSLSVEVAQLRILVAEYKKTLGDKAEADASYIKAQADLNEKNNALIAAQKKQQDDIIFRTGTFVQKLKLAIQNVGGVKGILGDFFGLKQFKSDAEKWESAIQETLASVKTAINSAFNQHFENENAKIEQAKENQLAFLDREKERVLAQAQSEEERATIERQFDQKRREVEKKAAEERKKIALKQAAIEFAVAAIKTYATYGWPAGLFAVAGLAIAYAAQVSAIKQQQFAQGGKVQPEKPGNGRIRTRSNIPVQRNGDDVFATVKRGEVILNQRQQRALGGPAIFKKIGVPGFATGGVATAQLGTSLRPPSFNSGYNSATVNTGNELAEMKNIVSDLASMIYASDSKEVVLNPNKVTKAQERTRKDVSIGTI